MSAPGEVTALLLSWRRGDEAALARLVPLVLEELRQIAKRCVRGERVECSVQATALVNEAYLRLVDARRVEWHDRVHFLAMAARLMRRVLVDHARARAARKRGGALHLTTYDEAELGRELPREIVALDEALTALETLQPRQCQVVELRFFAGLTVAETADALHVSPETVMRDWKAARVWLREQMRRDRR